MLLTLLDIILPVLVVSLAGFLFARRLPQAPDMAFINHANVALFCPALVFSAMLHNPLDVQADWPLLAGGVAIIVLPGLLLCLYRPAGIGRTPYLVAGMFRNTGNVGIPLMVLAYGSELLGDIVLLFVLSNLLHFSIGLFLLSGRDGRWQWLRNPNIWAAVLGVALAPWQADIPRFVQVTAELLGQIAIPLMLFSLGVRLAHGRIAQAGLALKVNLLYLLAGAIAAALVVLVLPLSSEWQRMLILSALLPPAVLNYLLCEHYGVEPDQVASVVLLGNLLSILVIPLVIAFTLTAI